MKLYWFWWFQFISMSHPSEKWWSSSDWVSDDIPYMKWKIKFMFETTNQYKHELTKANPNLSHSITNCDRDNLRTAEQPPNTTAKNGFEPLESDSKEGRIPITWMVLSADFVPIFNGRIKIKVIGMVASQFQWELKPQNNPTPTVCADFCCRFSTNIDAKIDAPNPAQLQLQRRPAGFQRLKSFRLFCWTFPWTLDDFRTVQRQCCHSLIKLQNTTELNSITLHHWCQASAVKLRQADVKLMSSWPAALPKVPRAGTSNIFGSANTSATAEPNPFTTAEPNTGRPAKLAKLRERHGEHRHKD